MCVWDGLIYSVTFGDHGKGGDINVEQTRLYLKNRMERIVELYSQVRPSLSSQRQAMKAMDVWCDMFREHCIDRIQDEGRAAAAILGKDPAVLKMIDLIE